MNFEVVVWRWRIVGESEWHYSGHNCRGDLVYLEDETEFETLYREIKE